MRTPFIIGNWKMHTTLIEAVALAKHLKEPLSELGGLTTIICPPFVSLSAVASEMAGSPIRIGAQNLHSAEQGAFTGEVSGPMLQGLCQYVIVGHSERRHLFGEKDELIGKKVNAALSVGLRPVLCIGETFRQRESGETAKTVVRQLRGALSRVNRNSLMQLIIAYEPRWAIGTGMAAGGDQAQEVMVTIREYLIAFGGLDVADGIPLLYGGSVTSENIHEFAGQRDVDGALVGGASLRSEEFIAIANVIAEMSPRGDGEGNHP